MHRPQNSPTLNMGKYFAQSVYKFQADRLRTDSKADGNKGLPIAVGQWFIEV